MVIFHSSLYVYQRGTPENAYDIPNFYGSNEPNLAPASAPNGSEAAFQALLLPGVL